MNATDEPTASVPDEGSHKYYFALDGLRAIALLTVMIHHYLPPMFGDETLFLRVLHEILDLGGLGVDLFFALSGFLITGILYDTKGTGWREFFGKFYWRRSLRIFPAYYLLLLPYLFVPELFTFLSRWWFVLYLRNWLGPDSGSDDMLGHLWSLAVEEQFYIVWAIAVFLSPKRMLPWLILLLSMAALPYRYLMVHLGLPTYDVIRFTPSRMDGLLLGGLVAIAVRSGPAYLRKWPWWFGTVSFVGFIAALYSSRFGHGSVFGDVTLFSWTAIIFSSLVALCLHIRRTSLAGIILGSPFLRHIAKYSYAMYLWHLPMRIMLIHLFLPFWLEGSARRILAWKIIFFPVVFVAVYGVARLSWVLVESPALRQKDRLSWD